MSKIVVPASLTEVLESAEALSEVYDEHGAMLGFFQPVWANEDFQRRSAARSPNSIEDLQELRKQKSGKPLKEILAQLQRENPA